MSETTGDVEQKAKELYQEAMKLNPEDNYSKEAEDLLRKALKLSNNIPDGYVALGYTVLMKGNKEEAVKHFRQAVKLIDEGKEGNKSNALCALSVGVRYNLTLPDDEASVFYTDSIKIAKDAIQADLNSGKAWYTLGMAYLSRFFHGRKYPKDLEDALGAFQFAEKKEGTPLADLHANRGTIFRFLASIHNARGDFEEALRLDPSFVSVKQQLSEIKSTYDLVHSIVVKKNAPTTKLEQLPTEATPLKDLDQEKNPDKILSGVVLQCASLSNETPQLFVCADKNDDRFIAALYDVTANVVPDGATLTITSPRLAPFTWDGKLVHPLIVVDNIDTVTVNKKPIARDLRALATIGS